ncbi:aminoglycoside phosphotransferase (APT) family kinase protein [Psychromicrobium silvestre]|uniref:Aminoglycoside phosphotransferase (APT) family kinase protein n=1 Tax=Psychromicrobium silvestre TaxID=1645614 RepID=A0A7Y9S854_9MICC|nr:aminoglycoside phosphotransferase family protein [Psychromicrobium silvestre]NYE95631.1 aminoglycoside phosphotransferase (APT) family kinase protein [Psychromicrobium silvestre]
MHDHQLELSTATVAGLIQDQFPQWRGLPIHPVYSYGTVSFLFRLGEELVLRFPMQLAAVGEVRASILGEAAAARRLLGLTSVATPEPLGFGEPGPGYPLPWAAYRWLPGESADRSDVSGSTGFAQKLAEFVSALRSLDTEGRRYNGTSRGGLLTDQDDWVARSLEQSTELIDTKALGLLWQKLRETPRTEADAWSHGDLMPGNLLVRAGRLSAVIDVGGLGLADPALDLMPAWNLMDTQTRRVYRKALSVEDQQWARGKGWAFAQAIGCLNYYRLSNPPMSRIAHRTLQALLDDGTRAAE